MTLFHNAMDGLRRCRAGKGTMRERPCPYGGPITSSRELLERKKNGEKLKISDLVSPRIMAATDGLKKISKKTWDSLRGEEKLAIAHKRARDYLDSIGLHDVPLRINNRMNKTLGWALRPMNKDTIQDLNSRIAYGAYASPKTKKQISEATHGYIEISKIHILTGTPDEIVDTVKHEAAHILTPDHAHHEQGRGIDGDGGHTSFWKETAQKLGGTGKVYATTSKEQKVASSRVVSECSCGIKRYSVKNKTGYYCPKCKDDLYYESNPLYVGNVGEPAQWSQELDDEVEAFNF